MVRAVTVVGRYEGRTRTAVFDSSASVARLIGHGRQELGQAREHCVLACP
jgi:hypothetical protein